MRSSILGIVVATTAFASALSAQSPAGRYIVMTRGAQASALRIDAAIGDERHAVRTFRAIDGFAATLTADEVAELRRSPLVRYVSPVVERHLFDAAPPAFRAATSSVYQRQQVVPYGIALVHAREAWIAGRGASPKVNVAILDTGIDFRHPDLAGAYRGGYNVFTRDGSNFDDNKHGTHVAGTIAAADNAIGVVGVAPEANIWSIKVLDQDGNGSDEGLVAGVEWVLAKQREIGGNWIMSLSLGSGAGSAPEQEAFRKALDAGILVVAAAGNAGFDSVGYPANYAGVFAVGAVDSKETIAYFSNRGPRLDIVAPGVDVLSTVPVGTAPVAEVLTATQSLDAAGIIGSPKAEISASVVFCGLGYAADFPAAVKGKIAFVRRGEISFNEKVRNAKAAGATAVIIEARQTDTDDPSLWTLIRPCDPGCDDQNADKAFDWLLTVAMRYDPGEKVLATSGAVVASYKGDDYGTLSGTSMATPHVTGVAALLWALAPQLSANDIKVAIEAGAQDIGAPGLDPVYGFGMVDALGAAKRIAPALFGLPDAPPAPGTRRRASH